MIILDYLMWFFGGLIIIYMLLVIVTYGLMFFFAFFKLRKEYRLDQTEMDDTYIDAFYSKPVSVIIPAYNEEVGIVDSIHSLLSLHYPEFEIIIVNDGSTDRTQEIVIEHFQMKKIEKVIKMEIPASPINQIYQSQIHPNCFLVEKENGGKADALNVGINVARYPYFCSVDGDSILESTSLLRLMKPIALSDGEVIAAGGNVQIANGMNMQLGSILETNLSKNYLVTMQIIEYFRAFLIGRITLSKFNLVLIISGAFSLFSKKWVVEAGGYTKSMIGEDMELVVKLHRYIRKKKENKRIEFVENPVCWTEAPETMAVLRRQRRRWHQGLLESLWNHKTMTFNPKYGGVGLLSFPYFWLIEGLGPIVELGGYIYIVFAFFLGDIYYEIAILLLLSFVLYGVVFSIMAVLFEAWSKNKTFKVADLIRMMLLSFTEMFWYRPITLIWRCEGLLNFLVRRREWGKMDRKGISSKEQESI
ncbi:glycosyltransferase family 2 protein [Lysinibacillus sphaericus]|uniref:glycosyltransferase family 2 protein n=1 Tax=Lysinibacillus sphaericus TaxID=1421 RepID=UPI003F79A20E